MNIISANQIILNTSTLSADNNNGLIINGINLTGIFVTTGQTGNFGGGAGGGTGTNVKISGSSNLVTANFTGVSGINLFLSGASTIFIDGGAFALNSNTGNFISNGMTGSFITNSQTGIFVTTTQTGQFINTAQTGQFAQAGLTGNFITNNYSGNLNIISTHNGGIFVSGGSLNINQGTGGLIVIGRVSSGQKYAGAGYVRVVDRYAYLTANGIYNGYATSDTFNIIDVSNPYNPIPISSFTSPQLIGAETPEIVGNYAYVASMISNTLTVLDISNPYVPKQISYIQDNIRLSGAQALYLQGNYAYVGTYSPSTVPSGYISIVDISNPYNPYIIGALTHPNLQYITNIQVKGKYAYVSSSYYSALSGYLNIVDVSNPISPQYITGSSFGVYSNYIDGKYAYCLGQSGANTSQLAIFDISNPTGNIPKISSVLIPSNDIQTLKFANKNVYITDYSNNAIHVLDVSNPYSPYLINNIIDNVNLIGADDIVLCGNYIYITANNATGSLTILKNGGIDVPSATVGNFYASDGYVGNRLSVGSNLYVGNSIQAGSLGIYSQGPVTSFGSGNFLSGLNVSGTLSVQGIPVIAGNLGTSPTSGTLVVPVTVDIYGGSQGLLGTPVGWISFNITGGLTGRIPYY